MRTLLVLALLLSVLSGCGSTQEMDRSMRETEVSASVDTSEVPTGKWDLSDAKLVTDSIVSEMLESRVLQRWTKKHEGPPTLAVFVQNSTMHQDEEIDRDTTAHYITQKLRNADKVQVAPGISREIRRGLASHEASQCCRKEASTHAIETARAANADFIVRGVIRSTRKDIRKGEKGGKFQPIEYTFYLDLLTVEEYGVYSKMEKKIVKFVPARCVWDPSC